MKKTVITTLILAVCTFSMSACNSNKEKTNTDTQSTVTASPKKVLIAYFTMPERDGVDASSGASRLIVDGKLYGNVEYIANVIKEETGGDLFAIKTSRMYPESHKDLVDFAAKEQKENARPKLATKIENLADYDVVFIGFPNWWYDLPQPLYSFFDDYDFKGKTIIPFCVHGGSGFSSTIETITKLEPEATIVKGYTVSRNRVGRAKEDVISWLKEIKMVK